MKIDVNLLEKVATSRKMPVCELIGDLRIEDGSVILPDADVLQKLAEKLIVPNTLLAGDEAEDRSDLDGGVKIAEPDRGYRITTERAGAPYYTFQHLATTNAAPELMALKLTLHCNREQGIVLNEGHEAKEMVYVLTGDVRLDWIDQMGKRRSARVNQGGSFYVDAGVPHSFSSVGETAEVISINYRTQ
jgi:uncharacterized RmlC-like cupin family protein